MAAAAPVTTCSPARRRRGGVDAGAAMTPLPSRNRYRSSQAAMSRPPQSKPRLGP